MAARTRYECGFEQDTIKLARLTIGTAVCAEGQQMGLIRKDDRGRYVAFDCWGEEILGGPFDTQKQSVEFLLNRAAG